MGDTRIEAESEASPSSGIQKETMWRRMEDEIEYMRIGCDKLARADKANSEHLGSLENQIATLGSESAVRLGALESQMSSITATLARIEANSVINQRPGKGIASSTMDHHDQVPIATLDLDQTHLGYRGIHNTLTNRDKMLRKVDMPVFAGPLPFDWISRVERLFQNW